MTAEPTTQTAAATATRTAWRRLSVRVIAVDLGKSLLSLIPGAIAVVAFDQSSPGALWPLAAVAVVGVIGAVADMLRWAFTRYRVSPTEVELRTGILVRRRRSVRRDRIRSIDTHANLRHRVAGLRVVTIGAGQQNGAGEAALALDALSRTDAAELSRELLDAPAHSQSAIDDAPVVVEVVAEVEPSRDRALTGSEVLATFRPWWVVYNVFSIWAYLTAAGLLWGAYWLLSMFGFDLLDAVQGAIDRSTIGPPGIVAIAVVVIGAIGAVGMGVNFLTGYWRFELARVTAGERTVLRTRRGLFNTREVDRDEARLRGMTIAEPLLWRWMGMADTSVITTGLSVWNPEQPTAILPRGPVRVAREVAGRVLGEPRPFEAPLVRHPRAALRRRLWWATLAMAGVALVVAVPVATGAVPPWPLWLALGLWPVALLLALASYRALGHAIAGDYLVVRSGVMTRSTSALRRDAVSTIAVRQSILQRRLGMSTVAAMTAGGWGAYEAPDVAASDAVGLAQAAAPGMLQEFATPAAQGR